MLDVQPTSVSSLGEEIGKRHPFESPTQEAFLNLMRTQSVLAAEFAALFRSKGLSDSTYNVLRILRGSGEAGSTCGQIRSMLVSKVPDVTRLVDRLEAAGLVTRNRMDNDGRVVRVRITQAGLERLSELDVPVLELHRGQLGHLSDDELATLSRLLERARRRPDGKFPVDNQ